MGDFYFAYDYEPERNKASRLCRRINHNFQRYDPLKGFWIDDNELSSIFIGEDVFYDEITEEEATSIITNWDK